MEWLRVSVQDGISHWTARAKKLGSGDTLERGIRVAERLAVLIPHRIINDTKNSKLEPSILFPSQLFLLNHHFRPCSSHFSFCWA